VNVFVTGATGYIGGVLVPELLRAGHHVVALSRHPARYKGPTSPALEWIEGSLREPETYTTAASRCEGLVHVAAEYSGEQEAVDFLAIRTLLGAGHHGDGPRVFVYTSGLWVLGMTSDRPVDETGPTDHPPAAVAWRPSHERAVLQGATGHLVTAVIRPGMVFGGHGGLFAAFFDRAATEGKPVVVGDGHNRWPSVHREDLCDAYLRILQKGTSAVRALPPHERIFHAVSGVAEPVGEIARAASLAAGRDGSVSHWRVAEARAKLGPMADALALDQVVAATRSSRVLGW
jgi:nucleoside-diphosphate-sugar epimerase